MTECTPCYDLHIGAGTEPYCMHGTVNLPGQGDVGVTATVTSVHDCPVNTRRNPTWSLEVGWVVASRVQHRLSCCLSINYNSSALVQTICWSGNRCWGWHAACSKLFPAASELGSSGENESVMAVVTQTFQVSHGQLQTHLALHYGDSPFNTRPTGLDNHLRDVNRVRCCRPAASYNNIIHGLLCTNKPTSRLFGQGTQSDGICVTESVHDFLLMSNSWRNGTRSW